MVIEEGLSYNYNYKRKRKETKCCELNTIPTNTILDYFNLMRQINGIFQKEANVNTYEVLEKFL
jgi:hypothetical protein